MNGPRSRYAPGREALALAPRSAHRSASFPPDETARLVGWMPHVVRSAGLSDWERTFCVSIIAQTRDPRRVPSAKQIGIMRRLVGDFLVGALVEDDLGEMAADAEGARA